MKKILIFLFIFFWVGLASANQSKTYTVKKGDTVYRIATKVFGLNWHDQVKDSWKNKDLIYPGDKIILVDLLKQEKEKKDRILKIEEELKSTKEKQEYVIKEGDTVYSIASQIFHLPWKQVKDSWKNKDLIYPGDKIYLRNLLDLKIIKWTDYNQDPFKIYSAYSSEQMWRDVEGLQILGLTKKQSWEVINKHQKALQGNEDVFKWKQIKKGDRISKVLFGDFYVLRNVIVTWENKRQAARVYTLSNGKKVWYPIICGNWMIKAEKIPAPPKPPPPPPIISAKLQMKLAEEYKATLDYKWDWDSTWGAFKEHYNDGNDVLGWWQTTVLYPLLFEDIEDGEWAFGLVYSSRSWNGETGDNPPFDYKGDVDLWALAGRYRDAEHNWEIIGRVGLGDRKDSGSLKNKWGRYNMEQDTDILSLYSSFEYQGREKEKWFDKTRFSLEAEFGFNEEKEDYWIDDYGRTALNGQSDDKDAYNFSLYSHIYSFDRKDTMGIWGSFRETYYDEGYKLGTSLRGGLSFFNEAIRIGPGYTWWNKGNPDAEGFYGEVNIYNLYRWFKKEQESEANNKELKKDLLKTWGIETN